MGEYAALTAIVAVATISLAAIPASQVAARLPTTVAKARVLVSQTAIARHVPPAQARAALARAPYRKPALRYLYATGWIGGVRNIPGCLFTQATPEPSSAEVRATLSRDPKLLDRLHRLGVEVDAAAGAIVRGVVSACGG